MPIIALIIAIILFILLTKELPNVTSIFSGGGSIDTTPTSSSSSSYDSQDILDTLSNVIPTSITNTMNTAIGWKQDKLDALKSAIANAEGFYNAGTVPARAHNPGDLGLGDLGWGTITTDSVVTIFPDDATGFQYLENQIKKMISGTSHVYQPTMTFLEIAQKYAGNWRNWLNNVTSYLGVSQDTRLIDWYNS